jgi:uncharacterized coiled-coil DUF342 family protein
MLRKKRMSHNPEIQEAMKERDALMDKVKQAVGKVDRLQDELLDEYVEAEELRGTP